MAEILWCAGAGAVMSWYVIWQRTSARRMVRLAGSEFATGSAADTFRLSLVERVLCCSLWSLIGAMTGAMLWVGIEFIFWLFEFAAAL
jgi:hypothetical protein